LKIFFIDLIKIRPDGIPINEPKIKRIELVSKMVIYVKKFNNNAIASNEYKRRYVCLKLMNGYNRNIKIIDRYMPVQREHKNNCVFPIKKDLSGF